MEHMNATTARKNLFSLISQVKRDSTPVHISSPRGNAVLVSEEDWNAMQETLYLKSIPGMTESILAASKEPTEKMTVYDPEQEW